MAQRPAFGIGLPRLAEHLLVVRPPTRQVKRDSRLDPVRPRVGLLHRFTQLAREIGAGEDLCDRDRLGAVQQLSGFGAAGPRSGATGRRQDFGHSLLVPGGPAAAERLKTVGVHRFVLDDSRLRRGVNTRLQRPVRMVRGLLARGAAADVFEHQRRLRQRKCSGRPAIQLIHDVSVDLTGQRSSPVLAGERQDALDALQALSRTDGIQVGVQPHVMRTKQPPDVRVRGLRGRSGGDA